MTVEHRTGDLFAQADLTALAHGCNCAGAMGAGIAVQFKKRFPAMYEAYKTACKQGDLTVGGVFTWREGPWTVFNLGTEKHWRTGARLEWIEASVEKMLIEAQALGLTRVALPRIGAGYGGLSWDDVRASLERLAAQSPVGLVVVSLPLAPARD